jgi:hypothetical protein
VTDQWIRFTSGTRARIAPARAVRGSDAALPPIYFPADDEPGACTLSVGSTGDQPALEPALTLAVTGGSLAGIDPCVGTDCTVVTHASYLRGNARITVDGVDLNAHPVDPATSGHLELTLTMQPMPESFSKRLRRAGWKAHQRLRKRSRYDRNIIAFGRIAAYADHAPTESEVAREAATLTRPRRSRQNRSKRARQARNVAERCGTATRPKLPPMIITLGGRT